MHHVVRVSEVPLQEPDEDRAHARGYRRASLVDRGCGAAHTGLGLCRLEAGGTLGRHLHSYEESFFVLEGDAILELDGRAYRLEAGDYGLVQVGVPHGWRNPADGPARWLEMLSPQPRPHPRDTFFLGGEVPDTAERPDLADPSVRFLGRFEDRQLPPPHYLQMDGYSGGNVEGISLKMMVDRVLGAQHLTMFMVEFQPGGAGNVHDHPFEECYFLLAGEADAVLDGKHYRVRAGDVVWTGVGGTHGFFNTGSTPVRWIETQAPQPPGQQAFRFAADWEHLEHKLGYRSRQEAQR
jgi:quercetin dioxygenase-like cupin family protein